MYASIKVTYVAKKLNISLYLPTMGSSNISNEQTEVSAPRTSTSQLQRTLACRKAKCHIDNIKDFIVRLRVSYYSPFTRSE